MQGVVLADLVVKIFLCRLCFVLCLAHHAPCFFLPGFGGGGTVLQAGDVGVSGLQLGVFALDLGQKVLDTLAVPGGGHHLVRTAGPGNEVQVLPGQVGQLF